MQPIRIGLIGCGGIATSAHLPAMAMLPGLVRLVAAADVRDAAVQAAAAPFGADPYTDYRQLLDRKDIDMVVVTTPDVLRREQVVAAAEAGKHILCEKPMASSLADADAMIAACERAGVRLMVGHSRRFTTRYQEIRRAVDSGAVGDVRLIRENERRARAPLGETGYYWHPGHWTGDPKLSVGAALTNAVHETDLFGWFAGSEPVRVFAEQKITRPGGQVPDFISITVTFANGVLASAEVSNSLPPGYPAYHQFELYGTRGAIRAKDHEQQALIRFRDQGTDFPGTYESLLHFQDAYALELAAFVAALREDRPVPLPASEARAALRLALTAAESARTGKAIDMAQSGAERGRLA